MNVNVQTKPVNGYFHAFGDWIHSSNSVKNNVDGANENLPGAINGKKVAQEVEIFALPGFGPFQSFLHILQIVNFQKKLARKFF